MYYFIKFIVKDCIYDKNHIMIKILKILFNWVLNTGIVSTKW